MVMVVLLLGLFCCWAVTIKSPNVDTPECVVSARSRAVKSMKESTVQARKKLDLTDGKRKMMNARKHVVHRKVDDSNTPAGDGVYVKGMDRGITSVKVDSKSKSGKKPNTILSYINRTPKGASVGMMPPSGSLRKLSEPAREVQKLKDVDMENLQLISRAADGGQSSQERDANDISLN